MPRWFQLKREPDVAPEQVHIVAHIPKEPAALAFEDRPVGKLAHSAIDSVDVILLAVLMGVAVLWSTNQQCDWLTPRVVGPPPQSAPASTPRTPSVP